MKLYWSKGACSLAPHIVLEDLGLPYESESVDLRADPSPGFLELSPLGVVPVLMMENGEPLTEVAVILQYLADLKPEAGLAPRAGTIERVRLQETLNFISSELHKGFNPLFGANRMVASPEAREELVGFAKKVLALRFDILAAKLGSREFLMPWGYTVADAYLFTILNWAVFFHWDLSPKWPALVSLMDRVRSRPGAKRALKAEGLL